MRIPDAVAGQLVVGLLTQGAPNRYGKLIEQLGDRQFLQFSLSPDFIVNGRDIVREKLGVSKATDAYFAWNSIAITDSDHGQLPCPDCEQFRGHAFEEVDGEWRRVTAGHPAHDSSQTPFDPVII